MKRILLICILFFIAEVKAQENASETPVILTKIAEGDQATFEGITLKFTKVLSDSRCPKDVNCIRAGEAIIAVEIYEGSKKVSEKTIQFEGNWMIQTSEVLFENDQVQIIGKSLTPYPTSKTKIEGRDYYLVFTVIKKKE